MWVRLNDCGGVCVSFCSFIVFTSFIVCIGAVFLLFYYFFILFHLFYYIGIGGILQYCFGGIFEGGRENKCLCNPTTNILIFRSFTGVGVLWKTLLGSAKLRTPLHINIFVVGLHKHLFLLLYNFGVLFFYIFWGMCCFYLHNMV